MTCGCCQGELTQAELRADYQELYGGPTCLDCHDEYSGGADSDKGPRFPLYGIKSLVEQVIRAMPDSLVTQWDSVELDDVAADLPPLRGMLKKARKSGKIVFSPEDKARYCVRAAAVYNFQRGTNYIYNVLTPLVNYPELCAGRADFEGWKPAPRHINPDILRRRKEQAEKRLDTLQGVNFRADDNESSQRLAKMAREILSKRKSQEKQKIKRADARL